MVWCKQTGGQSCPKHRLLPLTPLSSYMSQVHVCCMQSVLFQPPSWTQNTMLGVHFMSAGDNVVTGLKQLEDEQAIQRLRYVPR